MGLLKPTALTECVSLMPAPIAIFGFGDRACAAIILGKEGQF
jgi:hypothetical protein